MNPVENSQAQFNQASYQQIRLNERIIMNQRLWNFPLSYNEVYELYNFEVIFNSQCQILTEIWPKLKKTEQDDAISSKELIEKGINPKNIFSTVTRSGGYMSGIKKVRKVNNDSWLKLQKELFNFGNKLMKLMDSHGLGNPNKEDPTAAVIQM